MERLNFGELKDYLRNEFENSRYWSDEKVEKYNGRRRRKQEKISVLY